MTSIMIAEDDLLIADMLEDVLVGNGYEVYGVARTVEEGVTLGQRCKPDLALLDVRLADGGLATEIVARLGRQGRPGILYATGNGTQVQLTDANGEAVIAKPYRSEDLLRGLQIVAELVKTGKACPPFPGGFHLLSPPPPLVSRERRCTDDVGWLRSQQAAFLSFAGYAQGESDLGRLVAEAARACAEIMGATFCRVWRFRPEKNDLRVEAVSGWNAGVVGSVISMDDEQSPQVGAFNSGQPTICSDGTIFPSDYASQGIGSILAAIIGVKAADPWGPLEVNGHGPATFDANDIAFMAEFTNLLVDTVSPARLNGVLQDKVERINGLIAERIQSASGRERAAKAANLALKERLVVTQELQHRVRNNLQLVYGMLNRQLKTAADPSERQGISAIARCVLTLGMVYDHLAGTGFGERIDFGDYLSSLCSTFGETEDLRQPRILLTCQSVKLMLDLDTVTALGLIVSELISNSYLHAFPQGNGKINVSLAISDQRDEATITLGDDGRGFQETGDDKRHGLGLVRRLVRQINGSVDLRSDHGTQWTLKLPVPKETYDAGSSSANGLGEARFVGRQ